MREAVEKLPSTEMAVSVNEAAFVAGVSVKAVNQAIDREHIRTRALHRARGGSTRGRRGIASSDLVFLRVQEVLAPEFRSRLYRSLRGKALSDVPKQIEMNSVVIDLERPIREIGERLHLLKRMDERITTDPAVRGGEPVFRGTRTPVYAIARKAEMGSSAEELREDYPHLDEGDIDLAVRYAQLHPRRGRPRNGWTSGLGGVEPPP